MQFDIQKMAGPIYTGVWGQCHIQGIAVDQKGGFIYYSFTTKLIKAKLNGEIVGSVDGLIGHLGCIAFNEEDGCVYGSLEYKNDAICRRILERIQVKAELPNAFYIAKFDVSKIDRMDIPAEGSGIMTAVFLKEVLDDFDGTGENAVAHKYGCSGIDGITFAPLPGADQDSKKHLFVAYGVYSDITRNDNNNQVILCYDHTGWDRFAAPLCQDQMHTNGPDAPLHKYFVYTGNTRYGVQNLEYDPYTDSFLMAVYVGKKEAFSNYSLFCVDRSVAATEKKLTGLDEFGSSLTLKYDGWHFPYGATGLYAFGDGNWLICHDKQTEKGQCGYIYPYRWDEINPFTCLIETEE